MSEEEGTDQQKKQKMGVQPRELLDVLAEKHISAIPPFLPM